MFPFQELRKPARARAGSGDASNLCRRVLRAGSGGSGGGGLLWPGCRTSGFGDERPSHCSGLEGALALGFHTSALTAGAGCPITQGEELLFL